MAELTFDLSRAACAAVIPALFVSGCNEGRHPPALSRDTTGIVEAALIWVDSTTARTWSGRVVVIDEALGWRPARPPHFGGRWQETERVSLPLHAAVSGSVQLRHVMVCTGSAGPRSERLCGTEPPWLVTMLSPPLIEGDSATILVDIFGVERTYDGGEGHALLLVRSGSGWLVIGHRGGGIYD